MRIFIVALVFVFISGCVVSKVAEAPIAAPAPLSTSIASRPVMLDRVVFDIARGTVIGSLSRGYCLTSEPIKWSLDGGVSRRGDYHIEFEKVVQKYNFKLPPKPASMFETAKPSGDELVIAAKISGIQENRCDAFNSWSGKETYKGSVRFDVHWEVYSLADLKVVLEFNNAGFAAVEEWKERRSEYYEDYYYAPAFGNALRGLLEDPEFRKLAVTPVKKMPAAGIGT